MADLFATLEPKPRRLKIGQGNGEFLARVAAMRPEQRKTLNPQDHPDAAPNLVIANRVFHGGAPLGDGGGNPPTKTEVIR